MSLTQGLHSFATELNKSNITFGIIGGIAMFAYGSERTTFDIDFLIHQNDREKVKEIALKLELKIFNENEEVLQLSGSVQLDIIFANRERSQEMLERVRLVGSFPYPIVAPEDLIGLKIQAYKGDPKREFIDKGDILTLIRLYPDLNFQQIKEYADIFNAWKEIEDLKNRV